MNQQHSNRIYGLDVYRAIAIIVVVLAHGRFMLQGSWFEKFPWIRIPDGVELFFVLSGFLIGGILIKIIHKNEYRLTLPDVVHFWKRRWYRTLPNYFLVLLLNILFVWLGITSGNMDNISWKFFLFLQNFSTPFYGFFWESWSLSIEEWFYIFLPLSFFLIIKFIPNRKGLLSIIILLIIAPLIYRIAQAGTEVDYFHWDTKFRKIVVMRLDTIIYGVLAAYIKFYHADFWKKSAVPSFVIGFVLTFAILYIPTNPNDFFKKTFFFNASTFAAMLMLPYADSVKSYKTWFGKSITHISLISYSMYLINLGLIASVINKHFPVESYHDGAYKFALYWLLVVVFSTVLYRYFEKPVMDLRDRKGKRS